jgi:glycosyltransferase involved in cell wall biosynthesis
MVISIIIPTFNEIKHIEKLIDSIYRFDSIEKEVFIVDGGSSDGTVERVIELFQLYKNLNLVKNPDKYVSNGFNKTFYLTKGEYISLVGAHSIYPNNYFSKCIDEIESGNCDAAGGFLLQKGNGVIGEAISLVMSSKFGVGDTPFRTERKRMYVDSVAFAVYKREIFEKIGLLDEELIRNQDDEFHYRMNAAGFRMLMLPDIEVVYFVRNSLSKLFKQYFQYGLFKPLVIKKVKKGLRIRHLVPALFVLYLIFLPLSFFNSIYLIPLVIYILLSALVSFSNNLSFFVKLKAILTFPVLHIAYGSGFLLGMRKMVFK